MAGYDLDRMPLTTAGKRMYARVSPVYDKSLFMKSWYDALGVDVGLIRRYYETLREQNFIPTVDWGIEYQEHKYSIVPDSTLSLEERRERLGIKAYRKYPLNPAVLEKTALDNYGLTCYLDEKKPGYIRIYIRHMTERGYKFFPYLIEEKPAHLALHGQFYLVDFIGEGSVPDDIYEKIIYSDADLPIPLTDDDRQRVPRIHAGIVNAEIGIQNYSLPLPKNKRVVPRFGFALVETGDRGAVPIAQPKDLLVKRFIGQALVRSGGITIHADLRDLPTHDDLFESGIADLLIADVGIVRPGRIQIPVATLEEFLKVPVHSGAAVFKFGSKTIQEPRPANQSVTMHAGQYLHKSGSVAVDFDKNIKLVKTAKISAGVALVRGGTITIDSETKPTIPPGHRYFGDSDTINLRTGAAISKLGFVKIDAGARILREKHKIKIHAGHSLIRTGRIVIKSSDEGFEEVPDGDWLRVFFDFPTGRDKPFLLGNPREDLIKGDVKAIGDFAVEEDIFRNSAEENTTGIKRAELIRGFQVNQSDDLAKVPAGGSLRLYFDFASGNKHRILLNERKEQITFSELKNLGDFAADNKILVNAAGDVTRGISRATVVKKFFINDGNVGEPINFEEV